MAARAALSLEEREQIGLGIARDESGRMIAEQLGRCASVVNREIARHGGRSEYSALTAQRRCERSRRRPKLSKLETDPVLAKIVATRLGLRDSPMTISVELARGTNGPVASISHECIYQAIYQQRGLDAGTGQHLHLGRRRRKRRGQQRPNNHTLGSYTPIGERPPIASERSEVGHLEGDLITGAYNRSAMITVFDRASRRLWLAPTANKTADAVFDALVILLNTIPNEHRRTLTWDQGSELAHHRKLAEQCGINIYICDKNAPWQRPTNENGNAHVRRYVGKGTNLNTITNTQRHWIEHRINTTPRRSLNWQTANTVYARLSASTP